MYSNSINTAYFYYVGEIRRTTKIIRSTHTPHPSPYAHVRERGVYPFKYSL